MPAMRLSGTLLVGAIRDAVQQLRDSSLEETETPAGRDVAGRIRREILPTPASWQSRFRQRPGWAKWARLHAQEPNGVS